MIFVYNANGDLLNKVPSRVYQGSNKASRIYFVAPFPESNVLDLAFTLPNGDLLPKRMMTRLEDRTEIKELKIDGVGVGVWFYDLIDVITAYAGEVTAQFFVTSATEIVSTEKAVFLVEKGVAPIIAPEDIDTYELIQQAIAQINSVVAEINNNVNSFKEEINTNFNNFVENVNDKVEEFQEEINTFGNKVEENKNSILALQKDTIKNTNKISALEGLIGVGEIVKRKGTMTALRQKTGGVDLEGFNISDGSFATVDKISGKTVFCENLIPYPYANTSKEDLGITFTANADGSVTVNGQITNAYHNPNIIIAENVIIKAGTYCFTGAVANVGINIEYQSNGETKYLSAHYSGLSRPFTLTEDIIGKVYVSIDKETNATTVYNNVTVYPMLNKGETALPYQPYFEGAKHAKISGIKSIGRNLLNSNNYLNELYKNEIQASSNINGVGITGGAISLVYNTYKVYYVPVVPNTDYTVKDHATGEAYWNFSEGIEIGSKTNGALNYAGNGYYSTANSGNYKYLLIQVNSGDISSLTVNFGATPIEYEPYSEYLVELPQTEELGEFDYIQDGQVSKSTSQAIYINGSEDWVYSSEWNMFYLDLRPYGITNISQTEPYFHKSTSVRFSSSGSWNTLELGSWAFPSDMILGTTAEEKLADFKVYFSQHPFWFVVRQLMPTIEPIIFDNEYVVANGGQEEVITPKDENGFTSFDYGANTTEEIIYYTILGGNE